MRESSPVLKHASVSALVRGLHEPKRGADSGKGARRSNAYESVVLRGVRDCLQSGVTIANGVGLRFVPVVAVPAGVYDVYAVR